MPPGWSRSYRCVSSCSVDSYQSVSSRRTAIRSGRARGDRLLDRPLDQVDAPRVDPGVVEVAGDLVAGGVGPAVVVLLLLLLPAAAHLVAVHLGRLGHAGERVVEEELALPVAQPLERQRGQDRRAAAPDAALHERAGDVRLVHAAHSGVERVLALVRGHRERLAAVRELHELVLDR